MADNQYDEITLYDYAVSFQEDQSAEQAAAYLARKGWEEGLLVHSGSVDVAALLPVGLLRNIGVVKDVVVGFTT